MSILVCMTVCVSFDVFHDYLIINKLEVCPLSILPPKKKIIIDQCLQSMR